MTFNELCELNVSTHLEKKGKFNYLSWTWAWEAFKKAYPDAHYTIKTFDNGLPYVFSADTGYMVFTEMTANGETHQMWLPVMDNNHNAMKSEPYEITTSYGKKTRVEAATMFDINTAIMRCLVKNMAMFGLGLYIYAGEDLPKDAEDEKETPTIKREKCSRCGQELKPITKDDGDIMPIGEVAKFSRLKYGKVLCEECMKAISKGATK